MMLAWVILPAAVLLASFGLAIRRIAAPQRVSSVSTEWIAELSPDRYQPLLRLLAQGEMDFLRSQPGFTRQMLGAIRRHRAGVIRAHLGEMCEDFSRICAALKLMMVQSGTDRPDLAITLLRAQAAFTRGMLMVHARLWLYQVGLGSVDISAVMNLFGSLSLELKSVAPLVMPA